ncbi:hypothetical protein [Tenacibaculum maritimum]|uniref:hypothetical protein n=1 Tax=Tenacibaculum maritimum TaxID=107401 RepID=UPI0012E5FD41|nr:hypothetical protein [Tenacibaculum maritimum]CAA0159353.1 conserved hypothetical protein [Tenacibaculum maritimum]
MAYNKKNFYRRVIEVQNYVLKIQELENEKREKDLMLKEIFWEFIHPKYHICYKTFHTYLSIPAKRELRKIEEKQNQKNKIKQLKLW